MHKILAALVYTVPQVLNRVLLKSPFSSLVKCLPANRSSYIKITQAHKKEKVPQIHDVSLNGESCQSTAVENILRHNKPQKKKQYESIIIYIQAYPSFVQFIVTNMCIHMSQAPFLICQKYSSNFF